MDYFNINEAIEEIIDYFLNNLTEEVENKINEGILEEIKFTYKFNFEGNDKKEEIEKEQEKLKEIERRNQEIKKEKEQQEKLNQERINREKLLKERNNEIEKGYEEKLIKEKLKRQEEEKLREKEQEKEKKKEIKHGDLEECWKGESVYECKVCRKNKKAGYWAINCTTNDEGEWIHCGEKLVKMRKIKRMMKKSQQGYFACCDTYENNGNSNKGKKYTMCTLCKDILEGKSTQRNHYNRNDGEDSDCMINRSMITGGNVMSYRNNHDFIELNEKVGEILRDIRNECGSIRYIIYYQVALEYRSSGKIIYKDKILYEE
jgi:flagellar biosynthesis GTPase FlhF